jgi:4-amino-4-deoxy-L-arabinose transferase-like glycosyltransferase
LRSSISLQRDNLNNSSQSRNKIAIAQIFLGLIILLSITGGVIAIYSTANGPWGYTDPVEYISTASSILKGHGLGYYEGDAQFNVITLHPPFYSVVLSVIGLTGSNLVAAARWVNIFAFVASIFIAGWIFLRFSRVPALGIVASTLLCTFPHMVVTFSSSYSEPLFIFLILFSGLCLLISLKRDKPLLLIMSALILGLVPFTRYAGIAMLASGIVTVFCCVAGNFPTRLRKTLIFALIGCLPTVVWLLRVYLITDHSVGGRALELNWNTLANQFQMFRGIFMDTVWKWIPFQKNNTLLPYRVRIVIFGIGLIATITLTFLANHRMQKDTTSKNDLPIFLYFGLSVLSYLLVLIATYLFTQPTIDINDRTLLPFFVCLIIGILAAFSLWQTAWFEQHGRLLQVLPWLIMGLCLYWYIPQTQEMIKFYHRGDGLTTYHWNHSEIIQSVRSMPVSTSVISNDWELLTLWTERPIYGFWNYLPSEKLTTTTYWKDQKDSIQSMVCNQKAALVIFNDFYTQFQNQVGEADETKVADLFANLSIYGKYLDGTIYLCP